MIREKIDGNKIYLFVRPEPRKNPNILLQSLIKKIKQFQNIPFANIFVDIFPLYFSSLIELSNKNDLKVKQAYADKTKALVEF